MRCITAEEREILAEAAQPIPDGGPFSVGDFDDMTPEQESLLDRMVAVGNAYRTWDGDAEFACITQRGRLALQCFAAVNARMG